MLPGPKSNLLESSSSLSSLLPEVDKEIQDFFSKSISEMESATGEEKDAKRRKYQAEWMALLLRLNARI
jgi:hypothetical protein